MVQCLGGHAVEPSGAQPLLSSLLWPPALGCPSRSPQWLARCMFATCLLLQGEMGSTLTAGYSSWCVQTRHGCMSDHREERQVCTDVQFKPALLTARDQWSPFFPDDLSSDLLWIQNCQHRSRLPLPNSLHEFYSWDSSLAADREVLQQLCKFCVQKQLG